MPWYTNTNSWWSASTTAATYTPSGTYRSVNGRLVSVDAFRALQTAASSMTPVLGTLETTTSNATTELYSWQSFYPVRIVESHRWAIPIPADPVTIADIAENHPDPDSTIEVATVEHLNDCFRISASGGRFDGVESVRIAAVTVEATVRGFMAAGRTAEQALAAALELYVHALFVEEEGLRTYANEMLNVMTDEGYRVPNSSGDWSPWSSESLEDLRERWRAHREERRQRWAAQREEREQEAEVRRRAVERAEGLLKLTLTRAQKRQLATEHRFVITGSKGNRYQICRGSAGNVYRLRPDGEREVKLCAHPPSRLPDADAMVAQKLMLETDEDEFLRIANHTPVNA